MVVPVAHLIVGIPQGLQQTAGYGQVALRKEIAYCGN